MLKDAGFRKKGGWSTRECEGVTHSFFLRSSRFNSAAEATFWIDVQVFSEQWHQLLFAPAPYKGPSEGTPCLLLRGLPEWKWPSAAMRIHGASDAHELKPALVTAAREKALPFLARCRSHAAVLESLLHENNAAVPALEIAGLYRLLGNETQAHAYMDRAKAAAVHENELRFLELREASMWPQHAA